MPDSTHHHELHDDNPLSEREREVARLLVTGASNAEIATNLVISPHTVKVHLRNIFEKLEVNSRTEASLVLLQQGWVVVPGMAPEGQPAVQEPAPPPVPQPLPLADSAPHTSRTQRVLLAAVAVCGLLLLFPAFASLAGGSANWLTDAETAQTGPVMIELEPRWEMRTPLDQPLTRLAAVLVGDQLYVLGGEMADGEPVSAVQRYDLATNDWSAVAPMPSPAANLAAAHLGQYLFAAGGSSGPAGLGQGARLSDRLYAYDLTQNKWQGVANLPYPAAGAALVADDLALYLIGGWDGEVLRDDIWRYVPDAATAQGEWELAGNLSTGRAFVGAAPVGGEIYVAGGFDGQRELDLVEAFNPVTGQLRELPRMGSPRGGLALVYDGLALYALGGGWTQPLRDHERFDFATNTWSNFPSPIQGSWRNLGAAGGDGRLHLIGGWGGSPLDAYLQYQSSFRTLLPVLSND